MRTFLERSLVPGIEVELTLDESFVADGVAVRRGRYVVHGESADAPTERTTGHFLQIWNIEADGEWRLVRGMFNG